MRYHFGKARLQGFEFLFKGFDPCAQLIQFSFAVAKFVLYQHGLGFHRKVAARDQMYALIPFCRPPIARLGCSVLSCSQISYMCIACRFSPSSSPWSTMPRTRSRSSAFTHTSTVVWELAAFTSSTRTHAEQAAARPIRSRSARFDLPTPIPPRHRQHLSPPKPRCSRASAKWSRHRTWNRCSNKAASGR